jgi:hypothetical protein
LADYGELEENDKTRNALELIDGLDQGGSAEKSEIICRALSSLVEKGIRAKALGETETNQDRAEREKLLKQYGIAEIAFVMAKGGNKISHEKEYRYDILARVIPIYQALKNHRAEIKNLPGGESGGQAQKRTNRRLAEMDSDQALIELSLYLAYYRDYPSSYHLAADLFSAEERARNAKHETAGRKNAGEITDLKIQAGELKNKLTGAIEREKRERQRTEPIDANVKRLGLLRKGETAEQAILKWRELGEKIAGHDWYANLNLPAFNYPESITGRSFDIQTGEHRAFMDFREPYSTYQGESEDDLSIQANQVVASTSPMAAAKLLVLDQEKQGEYFNRILRPLLVNYYVATSKSKEEAAERFQAEMAGAATISEIIELAQKKIIWPLEMGLRRANQPLDQAA